MYDATSRGPTQGPGDDPRGRTAMTYPSAPQPAPTTRRRRRSSVDRRGRRVREHPAPDAPAAGQAASPDALRPPAGEPAEAEAPAADDPLADGAWTASEITSSTEYGITSVTARVTNTSDSTRSGMFTLTAFDQGG